MPRLMARLGALAQQVWSNGGLYQERAVDDGNDDGDAACCRAVVLLRVPSGLKARPVVEVAQSASVVSDTTARSPWQLTPVPPSHFSDDSERHVAVRLPLSPSEHSCGAAVWRHVNSERHVHLRCLPCVQHLRH